MYFLCSFDAIYLKQVTSEEGNGDSYDYYVNLCRPLLPMPGINCPAGAWACRVAKKAHQDTGKHDVQVKWVHFVKLVSLS